MEKNIISDTVDLLYKLVSNIFKDILEPEEYEWLTNNKEDELNSLFNEAVSESLDNVISYSKGELPFTEIVKKVNNFLQPKLRELLEDGYYHQTNPLRSSLDLVVFTEEDVINKLVNSNFKTEDTFKNKKEDLEEFLRETVLGLGLEYEDYYGEVYITDYFEEDPKPKVLAIIKAEKEGNYYEVETENGLYIPLVKEHLLDFLVQSKVS